jgi:hypothetical protein
MKVLRHYGFCTQHEPRQFGGSTKETRPDATVFLARISQVFDVTVVTNTASSHVHEADPAANAAAAKEAKHGENVRSQGTYEFVPLAMTSSGHVDPEFDNLVSTLSHDLPLGTTKQFRRSMCFAVSVGLQRGNARILKHAYHRLEEAATWGSIRWA